MRKINKLLNTRIIAIVAVVCFLSTLVYCPPAYSYAYSLRVPMDDDYDRLNEINSNQDVGDEGVSDKDNESNMSRREFLKRSARYAALTLIIATLPILLTGNPEKIIKAIEKLDKYTLSLDYLYSLTKKEGSAYIQGIYYAINANKVDRIKAETFLRRVFKEGDLIWMRAEAIKLLVRHNFVKFEEAKKILNSTPDVEVVLGIYDALAEAPTEEVIFFLRDRIKKEPRYYINQAAFYKSLENATAIPQEIVNDILKASQQKKFFGYHYKDRGIWAESLGILARKNPKAHKMLIDYARNIKDPSNKYMLFETLALDGSSEAESLLLQSSRDTSEIQHSAWLIVNSLSTLNTPASQKRILELSYEINKYPEILNPIIRALVKLGTSDSARRLVQLSREFEDDEKKTAEFGRYLGKAHFPEVEQRLLELSHDRREDVRKIMAYSLADLGTEKAEKRLLAWSRDERETETVKHFIIQGLGNLGTTAAKARLLEMYKQALRKEDFDLINYSILEQLTEHNTKETVDWMISQLATVQNNSIRKSLSQALFEMAGFKSIELLRSKLVKSSGQAKENIHMSIEMLIGNLDAFFLRSLNTQVDYDVQRGEEQISIFVNRLRNHPEALYLILSLSQETTSHSFPLAYNYLREYITEKYGTFDIFRYISEEWQNMFLPEFLFTLTIFDKLEESFTDTRYSPRKLAELILSDKAVQNLLIKPALFSKVISNIMNFKDISLKEVFIDRILRLGKKNIKLKVLISLMLEFKLIPKEDRFSSLATDLPVYNPTWRSPQKDWLKDDVLSVGLYWSTVKGGEKAHYEQFPGIFIDGSKVNSFYSNFGGYVDKSKDPDYKDKLIKNGAEKILVKEFPGTNRKIEIYLYSSLDAIKASPHSITISRGHAGEEGNDDYPGLPGTLRFASHCRSIDDSDELIKANPDSPTITITGTGRAVETNPTLYYLLEYLGGEETWGNWRTIKEYIKPHIPKSIRKYNFPTDDMSFIYAVILQKLKHRETQKSSSSNMQMGIIGALKALESLGSKL